MKYFLTTSIFLTVFSFTAKAQPSAPVLRGVNVATELTEKDVRDAAALGANVIRLTLAANPMMELEAPYAFNEAILAYTDSVVNWSEKYGIGVIIDPHRYPGTEHPWTMLGSDPFWQDFAWHEPVLRLWAHLAQRYQDRGEVIAGYDLLNEPSPPLDAKTDTPADLSLLYQKLVDTIRHYDQQHVIVLAAPRVKDANGLESYIAGLDKITFPEDEHLMAEVHMYSPMEFTHQGVWDSAGSVVPYPVTLDGVRWDKQKLAELFQPAAQFAQSTGIPVLVGEFSCPRWLGTMGNQYLRDVIKVCEADQLSWAYHAYRENDLWDPERSNFEKSDISQQETTPRLELLKEFFARNGKQMK